jgi:hypothetical protein
MINFQLLNSYMTRSALGFIPQMLSVKDPRPAKEQLHEAYAHGGGWHPFTGFSLEEDNTLTYLDDPPLYPLAKARLRDELIILYDYAWVAIIQPNREFEVGWIE